MAMFIKNTNYLSLDGIEREISEIVERSDIEAELVTLGHSAENRPIYGVCFGDGDYRKPETLFLALTHAMEFVGASMAMATISSLAARDAMKKFGGALEKINVWIIPVLNPDGYAAVEKNLSGATGIAMARKNSRGVDLNRNFPVGFYHFPKSIFAGSPVKASPHYRGGGPCSEPESQVLRDFILGRNIKTSISFHSFGKCVLIPSHYTKKPCADHNLLMRMGSEMVSLQKRPYTVKPGWKLYSSNGDIDDWLYDERRILPFTFEIGGLGLDPMSPDTWINPFYWANPLNPADEIRNVLPATLSLIEITARMFA